MYYIMGQDIKNLYNKYSYSKIQTFESCPQKFKINYIDKIRKPNESIEAFMGKRVHEVLDWLYKERIGENNFISLDILLNKYDELWVEKWHENIYSANLPRMYKVKTKSKNEVYQNGIKCLVNYYNRYKPQFNLNTISTEFECSTKIKDFNFFGIIDRVDKYDDGIYEIYDYKTGKKVMSQTEANNNLQLAIYQFAIQEKYLDYQTINLNWYFLRANKIITVSHTKEKLKKIKKKIIKRVLEINTEKKFKAKESILCEWCYLWDECEIKSKSNPAINLI